MGAGLGGGCDVVTREYGVVAKQVPQNEGLLYTARGYTTSMVSGYHHLDYPTTSRLYSPTPFPSDVYNVSRLGDAIFSSYPVSGCPDLH